MPNSAKFFLALAAIAAAIIVAPVESARAQGLAQSIFSKEDPTLCITINGAIDDEAPLVLALCAGRPTQLFQRDLRTNKVQVHARRDLCISGDFGPDDTISSGLKINECREGNEDRWATNARGEFRTPFGTLGDLCWTAAALRQGAKLDARRCNGRTTQQFVFNSPVIGSAPPPASGNVLRSGRYIMVSGTHQANVTITVTGNTFTGRSEWACCPGLRVDPLVEGIISGDQISFVRVCTGQGYQGPCRQSYSGRISGNTVSGIGVGTGLGNNPGIRWSMRPGP